MRDRQMYVTAGCDGCTATAGPFSSPGQLPVPRALDAQTPTLSPPGSAGRRGLFESCNMISQIFFTFNTRAGKENRFLCGFSKLWFFRTLSFLKKKACTERKAGWEQRARSFRSDEPALSARTSLSAVARALQSFALQRKEEGRQECRSGKHTILLDKG